MVTDEVFEKALREVVAASPEFVYERPEDPETGRRYRCKYIDPNTGKGSCGVGQALVKVGVEVPPNFEGGNAISVLMALTPEVSPRMRDLAVYFQSEQDSGTPWGQALRLADSWTATVWDNE